MGSWPIGLNRQLDRRLLAWPGGGLGRCRRCRRRRRLIRMLHRLRLWNGRGLWR